MTVHAEDKLRFDHGQYQARAGSIGFAYVDDGSLPHTLTIDGHPEFLLKVDASHRVDTGAITLAPGTYTIYCTVPGHRAAGMQATLTVS